jgi:hypothetical protein
MVHNPRDSDLLTQMLGNPSQGLCDTMRYDATTAFITTVAIPLWLRNFVSNFSKLGTPEK